MIMFEDQDAEYEVEELKRSNTAVRIRIVLFFIIFIVFIFSLAKNGFSFDFSNLEKADVIDIHCDGIEYNSSDDIEMKLTKAMEVLNKNSDEIQSLKGYVKSSADLESTGYKGKQMVVIQLVLNQVDESKNLPDDFCGYKLNVVYR